MSRHRRRRVAGRARSTVLKTAAAMGVATAIAAGAHSVAEGPVHTQASSQPRDDVPEISEGQVATAENTAQQTPADRPSDVASDSAGAPQAVRPATHQVVAGTAGTAHAGRHASGAVARTPSTHGSVPSATPTAPAPSTSAPNSAHPASPQPPSSQPPASASAPTPAGSGQGEQGGLLGGVVRGVEGVLGGLLG